MWIRIARGRGGGLQRATSDDRIDNYGTDVQIKTLAFNRAS